MRVILVRWQKSDGGFRTTTIGPMNSPDGLIDIKDDNVEASANRFIDKVSWSNEIYLREVAVKTDRALLWRIGEWSPEKLEDHECEFVQPWDEESGFLICINCGRIRFVKGDDEHVVG